MMKLTVAVLALIGALTVANATTFTACPVNGPQLCKDCQAAVSSVAPDYYGNTVESLKTLCTKCNSDLCKQCLTYASEAFGGPNEPVSYFPKCTRPYVLAGAAALYGQNGLFAQHSDLVAQPLHVSPNPSTLSTANTTKALCPYIQTQDTLKCFDLGYGDVASSINDNYGSFEYLCVAAQSDLQRRCMYQYTKYTIDTLHLTGGATEGLPTLKYAILQHTLPLCLFLQSEAEYTCLKNQVTSLVSTYGSHLADVPSDTTQTVAIACTIAKSVTTQYPCPSV